METAEGDGLLRNRQSHTIHSFSHADEMLPPFTEGKIGGKSVRGLAVHSSRNPHGNGALLCQATSSLAIPREVHLIGTMTMITALDFVDSKHEGTQKGIEEKKV